VMVLKEEIELQGKGSTTQKGIVETAPSLLLNLLLLRADLRVFRNRIKSRDCANRKGVLKTRDIPTLNYRSPATHQLGLQSPLRILYRHNRQGRVMAGCSFNRPA